MLYNILTLTYSNREFEVNFEWIEISILHHHHNFDNIFCSSLRGMQMFLLILKKKNGLSVEIFMCK